MAVTSPFNAREGGRLGAIERNVCPIFSTRHSLSWMIIFCSYVRVHLIGAGRAHIARTFNGEAPLGKLLFCILQMSRISGVNKT